MDLRGLTTPCRPPRRSAATDRPATAGSGRRSSKGEHVEVVDVQAVLRVRPFTPGEIDAGDEECMHVDGNVVTLTAPDGSNAQRNKVIDDPIVFDDVLTATALQPETFTRVAKPLADALLAGQSSVLLTFGVTNSGKSHTIIGRFNAEVTADGGLGDAAGIVPRLFAYTLAGASAAVGGGGVAEARTVSFACMEVYNDRYFDLLKASAPATSSSNLSGTGQTSPQATPSDRVRSALPAEVSMVEVPSLSKGLAMLQAALAMRHSNSTKMNSTSSRSHAVFVFRVGVALLFVIDAGGTERVHKSEAEGMQLKESMAINQSVSAIRRVFETLRFNQTHRGLQQVVPFRTNKLTLLLKPVFTGGAGRLSKFVVLLNAYPGKKDFDEKRNALKFALDAKDVSVEYVPVKMPPSPIRSAAASRVGRHSMATTPTHMRESPLFARWDNEARVASVLRELSVSTPLGASADVPPRSTCTTATSPVTCGTTDRRLQTSPALAFVLNSAERQRVVGHAVSDLLSDIVMRSAAVADERTHSNEQVQMLQERLEQQTRNATRNVKLISDVASQRLQKLRVAEVEVDRLRREVDSLRVGRRLADQQLTAAEAARDAATAACAAAQEQLTAVLNGTAAAESEKQLREEITLLKEQVMLLEQRLVLVDVQEYSFVQSVRRLRSPSAAAMATTPSALAPGGASDPLTQVAAASAAAAPAIVAPQPSMDVVARAVATGGLVPAVSTRRASLREVGMGDDVWERCGDASNAIQLRLDVGSKARPFKPSLRGKSASGRMERRWSMVVPASVRQAVTPRSRHSDDMAVGQRRGERGVGTAAGRKAARALMSRMRGFVQRMGGSVAGSHAHAHGRPLGFAVAVPAVDSGATMNATGTAAPARMSTGPRPAVTMVGVYDDLDGVRLIRGTAQRQPPSDIIMSTEEATPATVAAMIRDGGNVCSTSTLLPAAPATESSRRFGDAIKSPIAALRSPLRCQATPRMSDVAQAVAPQPVTVATSTAAAKLEGATRTLTSMGSTVTKEAWATLSDLFGPSFDLAVTDVDGDPLLWADDAPVIAAASRDASDASFAVAPTESWSHVLTTSRGRAVNGGGATGPASQTSVTFPEFPQFSFPEVASKQAAAPTPAVAAPSTTAVLSATPSLQQQQQQQPQTTSTATTAMIKKTPSFKSPSRVDKEDAAPAACYLCSTSSNVKKCRVCCESVCDRRGCGNRKTVMRANGRTTTVAICRTCNEEANRERLKSVRTDGTFTMPKNPFPAVVSQFASRLTDTLRLR